MSKNIIIIIAVVILAIVAYFIFTNQGSAPATTSVPATGQPAQTNPVAYTDASSFSQSFLQCNPSELKMPFPGNSTYVITVFGVESGNCHYAVKVTDQNGVAVQGGAGGIDCRVPKVLINSDVLDHLFGVDKASGKESILAEQNKIEADYCVTK